MSMLRFTRRLALSGFAALALTACGGSGADTPATPTSAPTSGKLAVQDIIVGDENAPLTLVEYASWTCGACFDFHTRIMPTIKADYIDTGKVKLVFREFPTPPNNVSVAGFVVARCSGEDQYYTTIEELFDRQSAFLTLARNGGQVSEALKQVAANNGIEGDEGYQACMADQNNRDAIKASIAAARVDGVTATPTFFLNGELMEQNARLSAVTFAAELDKALEAAGVAE
jgi:protein-disulfide isomerase